MLPENLEKLRKFLADYPNPTERHCFEMGYSAAINGPDETNCNFSLFSTREKTKAWENGKRAGDAEKAKIK